MNRLESYGEDDVTIPPPTSAPHEDYTNEETTSDFRDDGPTNQLPIGDFGESADGTKPVITQRTAADDITTVRPGGLKQPKVAKTVSTQPTQTGHITIDGYEVKIQFFNSVCGEAIGRHDRLVITTESGNVYLIIRSPKMPDKNLFCLYQKNRGLFKEGSWLLDDGKPLATKDMESHFTLLHGEGHHRHSNTTPVLKIELQRGARLLNPVYTRTKKAPLPSKKRTRDLIRRVVRLGPR